MSNSTKKTASVLMAFALTLTLWQVPAMAKAEEKAVFAGGVELSESTSVTEVPKGADCSSNEIMVVFKDGVSETQAETLTDGSKDDVSIVDTPIENEVGVVKVESGTTESALKKYLADPDVAYVQPNIRYKLESAATELNDTYANYLWYLDKIKALSAWSFIGSVPHSKVRVAVIDSGVDIEQPDLQKALNKSKSYDETIDSSIDEYIEDCDHGTSVCGIIAAQANNGIGTAGVAGKGSLIDLVAIRAGDDTNGISSDDLVDAVKRCMKMGVKVINMSIGAYDSLPLEKAAMSAAYKKGIVLVAAAGNDGNTVKEYPAAYDDVISVINTTKADKRDSSSTYGSWCEISAPGTEIAAPASETEDYGRSATGSYELMSGTSAASPVVSAVAAMMFSVNPNLTSGQVRSLLRSTADDIGAAGKDNATGYGRVNAYEAVKAAYAKKIANATKASVTSITAKNATALTVKWSAVSGATGYEVYRATSKTGTYKKVANVTGKTSHTNGSLIPGKMYYYKVRAYVTVNGVTTTYGFGSAKGRKMTAPAPSSVKAAKASSTSATVMWSKVANAKGYYVYRATSKSGAYKKIATVKNAQKYTNKSLSKGKTYYYKICAYATSSGKAYAGAQSSAVKAAL